MPLILDQDRIPPRWGQASGAASEGWAGSDELKSNAIELALLINMPDAALEDTELQFLELLEAAAKDIPVHVKLFSLPELPRNEQAQEHLRKFYFGIEDLWNSPCDIAIITGTEPRRRNLRDEPYWRTLVDILDWTERNTISTVLSCLAVHAGVLHSDGIERRLLSDKQFGVFDFSVVNDHFLTRGAGDVVRTPHSRWNEIREDALRSAGYQVLARSAEAGADSFVKMKGKSLTVHFQGHPEYHAETLLKEYRRDIRRFLRKERDSYPTPPKGYFDATATKLLENFRQNALSRPRQEVLAEFPEAAITGRLQSKWRGPAERIYRNWLEYVAARKAGAVKFVPDVPAYRQ